MPEKSSERFSESYYIAGEGGVMEQACPTCKRPLAAPAAGQDVQAGLRDLVAKWRSSWNSDKQECADELEAWTVLHSRLEE